MFKYIYNSIFFIAGCTNLKLKKDYNHYKSIPGYVDRAHYYKEDFKELDYNKAKVEFIQNQVQRSLLAGLLTGYFYKYLCYPDNQKVKCNIDPDISTLFNKSPTKKSKSIVHSTHLWNIMSLFPPANYSLPIKIDSFSFEEALAEVPDTVRLKAAEYYFYKISIDKTPNTLKIDGSWSRSDSIMYFENNQEHMALAEFITDFSRSDTNLIRFYLDNLILGVKKDFFVEYFPRKLYINEPLEGSPYLYMNFGGNFQMMFLSNRFIQYVPSRTALWALISDRDTDYDKDIVKTQDIYLAYFKIALYSDYQPTDFKIVNDKGGIYQYTFYSKRYKQMARLKFNADRPHVFDIKLLD